MTDYANLTIDQLQSMSDEEFAKLDVNKIPMDTVPEPEPVVSNDVVPEPEPTPTEPEPTPEPEPEVVPELTPNVKVPGNEATPNGSGSEADTSQAGVKPNKPGTETQETKTEEPQTQDVAKAFFEKVTGTFNANGREYKIDNAEDVVSLMQKGLNYNQKMAALKPSMKIVKALQEHGIESVEQLGYLLDLQAKKPEAIAKLVQESGIDAYDLNEEKASSYVPSVPQVSDAQINFEMTAKALEGNPNFGKVVQELSAYDAQSKEEIFNKPHLLNLLTDHVANGYYDKICARLEQEQALGRLNGVPFLQAYDMVGNMLFGQPQQVQTQAVPSPIPVPVATKPNTVNNTARKAAAGAPATNQQVQKVTLSPEELWNLSDEEFAKIDPKFL